MKKILISLTLLLTISMASTETSNQITDIESINTLLNEQVVVRGVRSDRVARENREVRAERVIKMEDISSSRIARRSREVRKNRLVMHISREARKIAYLLTPRKNRLASLK
jgi:uncharacterized protein YxeA